MNAIAERRCRMEEIFARPFIELIILAPQNPLIRGMILAQTGQMPAIGCDTFDRLREWVETHCEKRNCPARKAQGIAIPVEFEETDRGRASYSVKRYGTEQYRFDAEKLLERAQEIVETGGRLNALVDQLAEQIEENAWSDCSPDMDDSGDYNYDDHDSNGSENAEITFCRTELHDRVVAFLQDYGPELLEELQ